MRIHSDVIGTHHVIAALKAEQAAGRIAGHVQFRILSTHRSQTHGSAMEVQLEATEKDRGRRIGASGSYGVTVPCELDSRCGRTRGHYGVCDWSSEVYAATYDEWGWLMAALYCVDPAAVWGSVKHPAYADADHFHEVTALTYNPDRLLTSLTTGTGPYPIPGDPYPYVTGRNTIGRRGASRRSEEDVPAYAVGSWAKLQPRTAEWVRDFAAGRTF
jgi:hypothetical protein